MARTAAFFRFEGVLFDVSPTKTAAWMALKQPKPLERIGRFGLVMLSQRLRGAGPSGLAETSTKGLWRALQDCSEDRLYVLAEEYHEDVLGDAGLERGLTLMQQCAQQGHEIVVLSEHPHLFIEAALKTLPAHELLCNHLELEDRAVTGRLAEPIFDGQLDGTWVRKFCAERGYDPTLSIAYGAKASDATLLSGVGRPCAAFPDARLRRLARSFDWPILET